MVAKIDKLDVFKEVNTIDALAGGDILKWEKVVNLEYELVFVKLYKSKLEAEYQERLSKVLKAKSEREARLHKKR